jgi:hypothetical protein
MKIKTAFTVIVSVFCFLLSAFGQGALTPPGAPAPTMKTLTQIEPRTDVLTLSGNGNNQYLITQSGSYYLTTNIVGVASKNGISIQADDVTLDLNGFTLFGGVTNSQMGISVGGSHVALHIRNGALNGWAGNGIAAGTAIGSKFENLRVFANGGVGIKVGNRNTLNDCIVIGNGSDGIDTGADSTLTGCLVSSNYFGISTGNGCDLRDCAASYNYYGINTGDGCLIAQAVAHTNFYDQIIAGNGCTLKDCTSDGGEGIITGNGCTLQNCSESASDVDGITTGDNCNLLGCTANTNDSYETFSISTGNNCTIKDCSADMNFWGIETGSGCIITGCTACNNNVGIGPGNSCIITGCNFTMNSVGLEVLASSLVKDNFSTGNTSQGISTYGNNNRIEGNMSSGDATGIAVPTTENIIYQNTVTGAGTAYNIAGANIVGTIVAAPTSGAINGSSGGAGLGTANPWANFSY